MVGHHVTGFPSDIERVGRCALTGHGDSGAGCEGVARNSVRIEVGCDTGTLVGREDDMISSVDLEVGCDTGTVAGREDDVISSVHLGVGCDTGRDDGAVHLPRVGFDIGEDIDSLRKVSVISS